jgi:hypothetical protein
MKLVDDVKKVWKHISTWGIAFVLGVQSVYSVFQVVATPTFIVDLWALLPDDFKNLLGANVALTVSLLTISGGMYALYGKHVKQKSLEPKELLIVDGDKTAGEVLPRLENSDGPQ